MAGRDAKGRLRNQRHEKFCNLFVHGNPEFDPRTPRGEGPPDTRDNAAASYRLAGYVCKNAHTAAVGGHRLLSRTDIRARINELRTEEERLARTRLHRWRALVPDAQKLLMDAILGRDDVSASQISAAKEVIEQAIGPTRFRFQVDKAGEGDGALNVTIYGGKHDVQEGE